MKSPQRKNHASLPKIFISFILLWTFNVFYDFTDVNQVLFLEFLFKGLSCFTLFKNFENLIPYKSNLIISSAVFGVQCFMKHFLLNNFLGFSMSLCAIRYLKPQNFKILMAIMLMSSLYEFYWVYENDKLLYILNSLDAPIKILFPLAKGYSFIGIIDIIVPGVILAFTLQFDCFRLEVNNNKTVSLDEKNTIYFNFILCSVFVGLMTLYNVLSNTYKPQAFLCYICSSSALGFLFLANRRKEMKKLMEFEWIVNLCD